MKNKKGFTLVELIASICILVILSTIVIVSSVKKINETKEKAYENMINSITIAAKEYIIDNEENLSDFKTNYNTYIKLSDLVNNEYLTSDLINPKTKESLVLSDEVYITKSHDGNIVATYDINQNLKPKIKLNGSYNIYVKQNSIYNEPGITLNGVDITNSVTTNSNLDTSNIGNYKIIYTYTNGDNTSELERNIIVTKSNNNVTTVTYLKDHIESLYDTGVYRNQNGLIKDNTSSNNIRYSGSNSLVKNYLEFNDEIWRIIGVFGNNVKIVKNESIGNYSWDSSATAINNGKGINQWGNTTCSSTGNICTNTTYQGSDLMVELNTMYLNKQSGTCYTGENNITTTCNFENGIDSDYVNMIKSDITWNVGSSTWDTLTKPYSISALSLYNKEHQNNTGAVIENLNKTSSFVGSIGLISPSDYGYASTNEECRSNLRSGVLYNNSYNYMKTQCKSNNWLNFSTNYWTLIPDSTTSQKVFNVNEYGTIDINDASNAFAVYPSLYLKENVAVKSGIGTQENPYKIYLNEVS